MDLQIEWNAGKAESNLRKHGVSFEEAATVLADPLSITVDDPDHAEERYLLLGRARTGRLLIVALTERGDTIRLISARSMTPRERRAYEQARGF